MKAISHIIHCTGRSIIQLIGRKKSLGNYRVLSYNRLPCRGEDPSTLFDQYQSINDGITHCGQHTVFSPLNHRFPYLEVNSLISQDSLSLWHLRTIIDICRSQLFHHTRKSNWLHWPKTTIYVLLERRTFIKLCLCQINHGPLIHTT